MVSDGLLGNNMRETTAAARVSSDEPNDWKGEPLPHGFAGDSTSSTLISGRASNRMSPSVAVSSIGAVTSLSRHQALSLIPHGCNGARNRRHKPIDDDPNVVENVRGGAESHHASEHVKMMPLYKLQGG